MKGNLIITREFLQVPGSTEWTLPSVAGWNVANTSTMEALKKTEELSTQSPCLFSPEMKGGLQVSRNCAFWLVFIDSEVLADRQTDSQGGKGSITVTSFLSLFSPRGSHCWHCLHIAVASPAGAGESGSCLSPRCCWEPGCSQGTRLPGSQRHPAADLSEMWQQHRAWCSAFPLRPGWRLEVWVRCWRWSLGGSRVSVYRVCLKEKYIPELCSAPFPSSSPWCSHC